jgi:hypothetical protein
VDSSQFSGAENLDLIAASLRASSQDLESYGRVLAEKLEAALPGRVQVARRRKSLLSGERVVTGLTCELGDERFALSLSGAVAEASRQRLVRGIALKTERLELDDWVDALAARLGEQARTSNESRLAVERLLLD